MDRLHEKTGSEKPPPTEVGHVKGWCPVYEAPQENPSGPEPQNYSSSNTRINNNKTLQHKPQLYTIPMQESTHNRSPYILSTKTIPQLFSVTHPSISNTPHPITPKNHFTNTQPINRLINLQTTFLNKFLNLSSNCPPNHLPTCPKPQ